MIGCDLPPRKLPRYASRFALVLLLTMLTIKAGETFVVMDCGGGTVDGSTYTVTNTYPLRLDQEVLLPTGSFNLTSIYYNTNT